ncbi:hypothetical protein PLICBS_009085 [Purpureocillium lilacinum]|uniref:uncharacterized protein n=1 Tax=Purpureocillium lilacinum TaxID=33203 RepID=UPI002080D522|nr:hypothetical protein PLICBS_009085 [Purpureocillium lilacinum]
MCVSYNNYRECLSCLSWTYYSSSAAEACEPLKLAMAKWRKKADLGESRPVCEDQRWEKRVTLQTQVEEDEEAGEEHE